MLKKSRLKSIRKDNNLFNNWSKENGNDWQDYFKVVSPARAVHDLRSAKISPWVIISKRNWRRIIN